MVLLIISDHYVFIVTIKATGFYFTTATLSPLKRASHSYISAARKSSGRQVRETVFSSFPDSFLFFPFSLSLSLSLSLSRARALSKCCFATADKSKSAGDDSGGECKNGSFSRASRSLPAA